MAVMSSKGRFSNRLLTRVRHFNKYATNRLTMAFAGRWLYSVIYHIGRRSGKAFATPVVAIAVPNGFIVPLPYSNHTDWCQNVEAAKHCTITYYGITYQLVEPQELGATQALPLLPFGWRFTFGLFKIGQYLRLQRVSS